MRVNTRAFLIALIVGFFCGLIVPTLRAENLQKGVVYEHTTTEAVQKATPIAFRTLELSRMPSATVPVCNAPKISCESFCYQCRGGRDSCLRDCRNRGHPCVGKC